MLQSKSNARTFESLPTEIHFEIAKHLPDYAVYLLARSESLGKNLRQIYLNADPSGERLEACRLSYEEHLIWCELRSRDLFERTPYPLEVAGLDDMTKSVWECARFYCFCCKQLVGLAHFPVKQMLESKEKRNGMSKITERKCFAHVMPVQLWGDRTVTWERLQETREQLGHPNRRKVYTHWDCHYTHRTTDDLRTNKSKLLLSTLDTLSVHKLFPNRIEARAEYFIDLCKPLRHRGANASIIIDLVNEKSPYICPHMDLTKILPRLMASDPINFSNRPIAHDPASTVVEVMVRAMEQKAWEPDPNAPSSRLLCKVKEQAIWCGFKGDKCRTSVMLQRFRDNKHWSVGRMRDLVRIKVVRKWRVDRGTGDEEWQAQNGVSALAKSVVVRSIGGKGAGTDGVTA